jgi:hypothetical protein
MVYTISMKVVCVVNCDTCGKSVITDPDGVSIFVFGEIFGVTACPQCSEPVFVYLKKETAIRISNKGAKIFSFFTGEEISNDCLT